MVSIPVVPSVLQWAREERGLSVAEAAERLTWPQDTLVALESGEDLPTLGQLQRMASAYQIALASLLMPAPLPAVSRHRLHDFRAYGGQTAKELAHETLLAIEEVNEYIDGICMVRDADPTFVADFTAPVCRLSDEPEEIAQRERRRLRVTAAQQFRFPDERSAFLSWRELIETQGVFVYQIKLGPDDSRGFAVWDERTVAAIVVDSSEGTYGPKSFTLWHEYAHLLLRMGGISNQNRSDKTERFCNQFAAAILMPGEDVIRDAQYRRGMSIGDADNEVGRLARRYRVSKQVVALRLEDLGIAEGGFYGRLMALWANRHPGQRNGRASHEDRIVNKLGSRHIETMLGALERGLLNKMDVYEFTSIKPKYFPAVMQAVIARHEAYGRRA